MIAHTLLYRFPETATQQAKNEFFAEMRDLLHATGLVRGFDRKPHLWLPADEKARSRHSEVIVQFTCESIDDLLTFSELPEVHAFLALWREKLGYEAAYINHSDLVPAPVREFSLDHAEHAVTANAPVELVWDVLVDVLRYPEIFPPTRAVTMVDEGPGYQLARFLVEVGQGQTMTWVSRRKIDQARRVIAYEQIEKAPMVAHMAGEWRAFPLPGARTQLVLTHDYAAREPVGGELAGKLTVVEAEQMLVTAIERNSVADLEAVRSEAERRVVSG